MIYLVIIGFGLFSLSQLKVEFIPDMEYPMIMVYTSYTGVSPEDIENLVTRPIEEGISATENAEDITSQSSEGSSLVTLEFAWGTDMNQAEIDVRNNLDLIRDALPDDATEPMVIALNPSMMPVMYMTLNSPNLGPAELRRLAEDDVEPMLERIEGVASVTTSGGLERQINVKLDPVLLAAHHLSPSNVASAISTSAGLSPAGSIKTATKQYSLRVYSEYRSLDQIKNMVVKQNGDNPVLVCHVAEVEDGYEELSSDVRINGGQGVAITVTKQTDANTVQTVKNIYAALPGIQESLPAGTDFSVIFDTAEFTQNSINNLSSTAIISFILAIVVIYFFLRNWRGSLIMAVSMPISIIFTFGVLMMADLTLNIISMAGLALAIGMLVDNSIVVLENTFRHRDLGEDLITCADSGASEVGMAITASTLTTVAVFLPVLFVPGIVGQLFKDMVLTIAFSLTVSLLVALTLVPMMSSKLLRTKARSDQLHHTRFSLAINTFFDKLNHNYKKALHWSIYHKKAVLITVVLLLVGSFMLFPFLGGEFMPSTDESSISLTLEGAAGMTLSNSRQIVLECEEILKEEVPELKSALFQFGSQDSWRASSTSSISATLKLVPVNERKRSQFEIQDALRKRLNDLPGITFYMQSSGGGPMSTGENDIEVKILGHDLDMGQSIAEKIKAKMLAVPGLVDVQINMKDKVPQLSVHLNQDVLNDYGLTQLGVASLVSTAIQGQTAAEYRESGDEYDIYVQLDEKYRKDRSALSDLMLPLPAGGLVPLKQLGAVEETLSPLTIYRENQERYVTVGCNLSGLDLTSATSEVKKILSEVAIPSDFTVLIGGNAEDQQESFFYLGLAVLVAVILVYMVMASQFESLVDPFIIMFTVPLFIIGVLIFLFITDTSLSVMALVGVVMLVGIAVNNGIVLVDYINQLRERGEPLYKAVEDGGVTRLRPVLMTALTTIFGMIPLALQLGSGAETWMPLARTVIGGLTMATLLTLIVIPVIYIIFEELGDKIKQKLFHRHA